MLIKSEKGNKYLLSKKIPQVLLLHPLLAYLIELNYKKDGSLKNWVRNFKGGFIKLNGERVKLSKEELKYYYEYFLFLKTNSYFSNNRKIRLGEVINYNSDKIKFYLANTEQICFEVTDDCNLKCKYCGYGELYNGYDERRGKKISIKAAKKIIDYLITLKKEYLGYIKTNKKILISFYGGEPLLNISFIKKIVDYIKQIRTPNFEFLFSMTTNGTLLHKYTDFLFDNDFLLLISLDGDKRNNEYRVFANGRPTYNIILKNIFELKRKYPVYFERSVNFISVIHNKNSIYQVLKYFKDKFKKHPITIGLSNVGVRPDKKEEFEKLKNRFLMDLNIKEIEKNLQKMELSDFPRLKRVEDFIKVYSGFVFNKIGSLLYRRENINYITTGTCNPFQKKVFVTVNGKILPCEKISQKFFLGRVDKENIILNFQNIADKYNEFYKKMSVLCDNCYNSELCHQCILFLNLEDDRIKCSNFLNYNNFKKKISYIISLLENTPNYYKQILNNLEKESKI